MTKAKSIMEIPAVPILNSMNMHPPNERALTFIKDKIHHIRKATQKIYS